MIIFGHSALSFVVNSQRPLFLLQFHSCSYARPQAASGRLDAAAAIIKACTEQASDLRLSWVRGLAVVQLYKLAKVRQRQIHEFLLKDSIELVKGASPRSSNLGMHPG